MRRTDVKRSGLLMTLLLALLCQGCAALPAEERSFAVVLGVDADPEGLLVMARVPVYQSGGGYATLQGRGSTMEAAMQDLEESAPMHLHTGQLRLVVLTHQLLADGRGAAVLTWLGRQHDVRLQAAAAITQVELPTLMEAMKPATGERLSKSIDVLLEARRRQGILPQAQLADVCRMGQRQTPALMHLTMQEGAMQVQGGWALDEAHLPAMRLTDEEMQLLSLMQGQLQEGLLTLESGTLRVTEADSSVHLTGVNPPQATVCIRLVSGSREDQQAAQEALAREALSLLNRLSAAGADPLGLGRQAVRHCRDMETWRQLQWPHRVRQIQWTVQCGVEPAA